MPVERRPVQAPAETWISLASAARILDTSRETVRRYALEEGLLDYRQLRRRGWIKVPLEQVLELRRSSIR